MLNRRFAPDLLRVFSVRSVHSVVPARGRTTKYTERTEKTRNLFGRMTIEGGSNLVRLGGILYGLGGDVLPEGVAKPELRPVMSVHSTIAHLKSVPAGETIGYGRTFATRSDSLIATVPIGYQDGYRRALSNVGRAIVRGKHVPVVGRISMDWTTLDVTSVEGVRVGDEVTVIGESDGLRIAAEDLARESGTISYEITCGIDRRVHRLYKSDIR